MIARRAPLRRSSRPLTRRAKNIAPNPAAAARRRKHYAKILAAPEYKAARAEAMKRSAASWMGVPRCEAPDIYGRCQETHNLEAHHKRYPKGRKLAADDLEIRCKPHHEFAESQKLHKRNRRSR